MKLFIKRLRVQDAALWDAGSEFAQSQGRSIHWLLMELLRQHMEAQRRKSLRMSLKGSK